MGRMWGRFCAHSTPNKVCGNAKDVGQVLCAWVHHNGIDIMKVYASGKDVGQGLCRDSILHGRQVLSLTRICNISSSTFFFDPLEKGTTGQGRISN